MSLFLSTLGEVEAINAHLEEILAKMKRIQKSDRGAPERRTQTRGGRRDYSRAPYIPPWTGGRGGFGGEGHGEAGGHSPGGTAGKPPGGGG